MKRTILATLGALAVITGLSNSVQARPAVESNSETEKFNLSSRNSSLEYQNRTVEDDYRQFFGVEDSTNLAIIGILFEF